MQWNALSEKKADQGSAQLSLVLVAIFLFFLVTIEKEVPVHNVKRQYNKHHYVSPAFGVQEVAVKSRELHYRLLGCMALEASSKISSNAG